VRRTSVNSTRIVKRAWAARRDNTTFNRCAAGAAVLARAAAVVDCGDEEATLPLTMIVQVGGDGA
jgi:hypothetical protein